MPGPRLESPKPRQACSQVCLAFAAASFSQAHVGPDVPHLQVLEAKSGTCFSHVKWFEIKGLPRKPHQEASIRPQKTDVWRSLLLWGLSDLQELVGPLSSQPRSVTANPWAGICPSGGVYSSDRAWTSGRFSFLQGQCDGRFSTFPTLSSPPGPLHIPTPLPNPRLKNPSQTLVRNTENLCVHRKIYFFLHFHSGSPRAVIFR